MNKKEEKCYNDINEGAIVVAEVNDMKILPLALQMDDEKVGEDQNWDLKQSSKQNMENVEKDSSSQNISHVAVEGDLLPKQTGKFKGKYTKQREKNEEDLTKAQTSSIQSKRTIVGTMKMISETMQKYEEVSGQKDWGEMYTITKDNFSWEERNMNMLAKMKRSNMTGGGSWLEILKELEECSPKVKVIKVI
ncbi:hypothetical protein H5410_063953 [Solanum commersonii]|uniref:Uncharacterized protein n=1 Tax=Solanum commersonii TaxID=4109 RepID=A0A9J5W0Z0_SOLCO|nr:hypothetical protein H5410_063953 [Solanum commersonii]